MRVKEHCLHSDCLKCAQCNRNLKNIGKLEARNMVLLVKMTKYFLLMLNRAPLLLLRWFVVESVWSFLPSQQLSLPEWQCDCLNLPFIVSFASNHPML